jgi:hypothetical protein
LAPPPPDFSVSHYPPLFPLLFYLH